MIVEIGARKFDMSNYTPIMNIVWTKVIGRVCGYVGHSDERAKAIVLINNEFKQIDLDLIRPVEVAQ